MRLDHIAYRVKDRLATANFFCDAFGYKIAKEFDINFTSAIQDLAIGDKGQANILADGLVDIVVCGGDDFNSSYYQLWDKVNREAWNFPQKISKLTPVFQGTASCIVLEPPEKVRASLPYRVSVGPRWIIEDNQQWCLNETDYDLAPEVFVSDGTDESIVGRWVAARGGVGGIHHLAYQTEDVRAVAKEWLDKGWGEFNGDILTCPDDDLDQIFTRPHPLTGVIYEFIKRGKHGFCQANVGKLMESTKNNDKDKHGYYK